MVSGMQKTVHIIPTSLEYERIGKVFEEKAPDRVYLLYNEDPLEMHDDLNDEVLHEARSIVDKKTMCVERGELEEIPINYYQFDRALVDVYRLIYRESKLDNHVVVNIAGGTKPVAIALAFACSLTDAGTPVYYVAKGYKKEGETVTSSGIIESPFEVSPLQPLDITDLVPTDQERQEMILGFLSRNEPVGVTDLLVDMEKIPEEVPDDPELKQDRNATISRANRYAGNLAEENVLEKEDSKYRLTENGKLIAKLIQVRKEVEADLEQRN